MPTGQGQSMKNEAVRNIGRQIEAKEDAIDAANERGEDTAQLEAELDQLEQQLHDAQAQRKADQQQVRADRKAARDAAGHGKSGQAPGHNKT